MQLVNLDLHEQCLLDVSLSGDANMIRNIHMSRTSHREVMASLITQLVSAHRNDRRVLMAAYALWMMVSNAMRGYDVPRLLAKLGRLAMEEDVECIRIAQTPPRWDHIESVVRHAEHVARDVRKRKRDSH